MRNNPINERMKIAFVYDRVNKFGGAERILLALHEIWPEAPLYSSVYHRQKATWASVFDVKPSFMQNLPFASWRHELYPLLTPLAFESFDLSSFDVVVSVTSSEAKGIITKPKTLHICYCLTPTRYLWSGYQDYVDEPGVGRVNALARLLIKVFAPPLRAWDYIACSRPDVYIAISANVKNRIKTYYRRNSIVIYPPVDTDLFHPRGVHSATPGVTVRLPRGDFNKQDYFLIVSRFVPYKKIDYAITAFNRLGWKLKIVGEGIDQPRLKRLASRNIEFVGSNLTDKELGCYYQNCRALIFPGEEDFGLTAIEAQASGRPVIAYAYGGVAETIIPGETGELYFERNEESLISALEFFRKRNYLSTNCRKNALRFSKRNFQNKMKETIENLWLEHKKRL